MLANINNSHKTPYKLLKEYFKIKSLKEIYINKFQSTTTKGIDRLSGRQFKKQATSQIRVIKKKCLNGTYKFSPYLELLSNKGRGKAPRVLAIPTIRDRIVLHALKEILFDIFPECKPPKLANTYVHDIEKFVSDNSHLQLTVFRADIKTFYDSIDREILLKKLKKRIKSRRLLTLIKRAIETPIVPKIYHRKNIKNYIEKSNNIGIPQGLSISNILASIYLYELDINIKQVNNIDLYCRYVDDILIFAKNENIDEIEKNFKTKIENLGLKLNQDKTYKKSAQEEFEYLGYHFELPKITVRTSTIEKFIHSIAAKFSSYIHNREKRLRKLKRLNKQLKYKERLEKLKFIFIEELNEKITGAISEKRRYGWIFYFNAINDESILYKIDNIIHNLFHRLDDFGKVPPPNLKKISRAFYQSKYNPTDGYIHNYNNYITKEQKIKFLKQRGELKSEKGYSEKEINELYEKFKQRNLSYLDKDDAILY